ncbi:hypothetical protein V8C86DRAFT_2567769 [Haematococcus lacustris]
MADGCPTGGAAAAGASSGEVGEGCPPQPPQPLPTPSCAGDAQAEALGGPAAGPDSTAGASDQVAAAAVAVAGAAAGAAAGAGGAEGDARGACAGAAACEDAGGVAAGGGGEVAAPAPTASGPPPPPPPPGAGSAALQGPGQGATPGPAAVAMATCPSDLLPTSVAAPALTSVGGAGSCSVGEAGPEAAAAAPAAAGGVGGQEPGSQAGLGGTPAGLTSRHGCQPDTSGQGWLAGGQAGYTVMRRKSPLVIQNLRHLINLISGHVLPALCHTEARSSQPQPGAGPVAVALSHRHSGAASDQPSAARQNDQELQSTHERSDSHQQQKRTTLAELTPAQCDEAAAPAGLSSSAGTGNGPRRQLVFSSTEHVNPLTVRRTSHTSTAASAAETSVAAPSGAATEAEHLPKLTTRVSDAAAAVVRRIWTPQSPTDWLAQLISQSPTSSS